MNTFPIGSRVLVDGSKEALIKGVFPEGSVSYSFPHYKIDYRDGDKNVAVAMVRLGNATIVESFENADEAMKAYVWASSKDTFSVTLQDLDSGMFVATAIVGLSSLEVAVATAKKIAHL